LHYTPNRLTAYFFLALSMSLVGSYVALSKPLVTPMGIYVALKFDFGSVGSGTWALLLFYALAASVWTVWLWLTGLKTVPAAKAGVFTVMLPVSSALVGVFALGETLSGVQLLAFAIALLGVVLATLPARASVKQAQANT